MKRVKEKLSFSNIIALIALFVALSGTTYAGVKIGTAGLKNRAVTAVKVSTKAVQWAVISEIGDERNGVGLKTSARVGSDTGHYLVNFQNNVDSCSVTATPAYPGRPVTIAIATQNRPGEGAPGQSTIITNDRQVEVRTFASDTGNVTPVDAGFSVAVLCDQ